jgi:hypothetical protein
MKKTADKTTDGQLQNKKEKLVDFNKIIEPNDNWFGVSIFEKKARSFNSALISNSCRRSVFYKDGNYVVNGTLTFMQMHISLRTTPKELLQLKNESNI